MGKTAKPISEDRAKLVRAAIGATGTYAEAGRILELNPSTLTAYVQCHRPIPGPVIFWAKTVLDKAARVEATCESETPE